jgi:hypothetical protein
VNLDNKTDARFAISETVAKAKARMLVELAGGKKSLNYAHALEATALGCGFPGWREYRSFNEKRASDESIVSEQMLAYDQQVDSDVRSTRVRSQRTAIQKYLECSAERAVQVAQQWALTATHRAKAPERKAAPAQRGPQERQPRNSRARNPAPRKLEPSGRPQGNQAQAKRPFRPDPLVSGVFLSGGDTAMQPTLRVADGVQQMARARGQRPTGSQGQPANRRGRQPNPLQSNPFVARREERSLREPRDDDSIGAYPRPSNKPGPKAEVTYKKRRTIEGQP